VKWGSKADGATEQVRYPARLPSITAAQARAAGRGEDPQLTAEQRAGFTAFAEALKSERSTTMETVTGQAAAAGAGAPGVVAGALDLSKTQQAIPVIDVDDIVARVTKSVTESLVKRQTLRPSGWPARI
jgi:hypothetical protein